MGAVNKVWKETGKQRLITWLSTNDLSSPEFKPPLLVKTNHVNNFLSEVVFMVKNKSWAYCEKKVLSRGEGYYF